MRFRGVLSKSNKKIVGIAQLLAVRLEILLKVRSGRGEVWLRISLQILQSHRISVGNNVSRGCSVPTKRGACGDRSLSHRIKNETLRNRVPVLVKTIEVSRVRQRSGIRAEGN